MKTGIKFHCKDLNQCMLGVNLELALVLWWGPSPALTTVKGNTGYSISV